jgi:hypothetical protein
VIRTPVSVPISLYQGVLPTVEVTIGGERSPFFLDTGAGVTAISVEEAARLRLTPFGRLSGHRMNGERIDMQRLDKLDVEIGGFRLRHESAAVLDLTALLPPDWPPIAGVLSLGTFLNQPVTLDLANSVLRLESEASLSALTSSLPRLLARIARPAQGVACDLFVAAQSQQGKVWFEVDSGNTGPTIVAPHAACQFGWPSVGNSTTTPAAEIRAFELIGFGMVTSEVVVKELIYDGNLGRSFLEDHPLTLDLRSGSAWLAHGA